ncbi:hypothetical protein [Tunturibacter empetritectus]|uniref:Uncharacterized protein n=1 Tax=Tunturiibacter lichenicola TaxID=2051959 RepID=A0A7W8N4X5_9BACT|nr:hypothetical protein [Edaphobacter lichenicola]MBB5346082.1 hypothetical protein [Edaphobacter lichenicola]
MTTAKKSAIRTASPKSTSKKGSARHSASARTGSTAAHGASSEKAHKTGRNTARGQAWTDQHSEHKSSTGQGKAKKQPAKQESRCWPGYEPVPGTKRGEKGSCKPKAHQSGAEKKSDAMAAAASKLRKG